MTKCPGRYCTREDGPCNLAACVWPLQTDPDAMPPGASSRDMLLVERQRTHGSFTQNAIISQQIKHVFHSYGAYPTESPIYCEALDMIALKLSRVLSGQANYADHWDDIAGYAKLASEACK